MTMNFEETFQENFEVKETLDSTSKTSRMQLIAKVQEADSVNKNKRMYPKSVLDAAVRKFKLDRSFSQLDHPSGSGSLKATSHLIKDLWFRGKDLMAEITVLNTDSGKVIREIIRAGGKPGLSSRGTGQSKTVKIGNREIEQIEPGYKFQGFDFITNASVKGAGVSKVLSESQDEEVRSQVRAFAGVKKTSIQSNEELTESEKEILSQARAVAGISKK